MSGVRMVLGLALALAIVACTTTAGSVAAERRLFAFFAAYSVALSAAADAAETPGADPGWVRAVAAANDRPEVRAARAFARDFTLCRAAADRLLSDECRALASDPAAIERHATALRDAARLLADAGS